MVRSLLSAVFLAVLALVPTAAAANSSAIDDPAGDVAGIPDITRVSATSTDSGRLIFRITFAAPPVFGGGVGFSLLVDADANLNTGHSDGVDYWFIFRTADGVFEPGSWDGQQFLPYPSKATGTIGGATATISVPAAEIGAKKAIRFLVASYGGSEVDRAPDSTGPNEVFATFAPKIRPPVSVRFVPTRPKAGKVFRAVGKKISCRATLAGRKLRRGCRWSLPLGSRGERLVVTVSNSSGRSRRFVFKVR
jgi:hypothetical protein